MVSGLFLAMNVCDHSMLRRAAQGARARKPLRRPRSSDAPL
jgi:hypothetical protein